MDRFEAARRTAIDGKTWWCVYDRLKNCWSTFLCHGKYRTRKEAREMIGHWNKFRFGGKKTLEDWGVKS